MTDMQTVGCPSPVFEKIAHFIEDASSANLPNDVLGTAKLYILDLIGVLAAASKIDARRIARNYVPKPWTAGSGPPETLQ